METVTVVVSLLGALLSGGVIGWFLGRAQVAPVQSRLDDRDRELQRVRGEAAEAARNHGTESAGLRDQLLLANGERERLDAELAAERRATTEKLAVLENAQQQLRESFDVACHQALQANNHAFLDLAQTKLGEFNQLAKADLDARRKSIDELVAPVRDGLDAVGETLQKLDVDRAASAAQIEESLKQVSEHSRELAGETKVLVRALRQPTSRGRWGEMQLRRVVELAGMQEHCDFTEQQTIATEDGRLRPDLLVHLPQQKLVVVDSKVPLDAYLQAMEAVDDAVRDEALDRHVVQVRAHVDTLASKEYATQFAETPNFVVMFLPGESIFSAACARDPSLIEYAIGKSVMPASPTTLITLLKAVAYGWQQERLAANTEQLRDLGRCLYDRVRLLAEHLADIRAGLEKAVEAYNKTVGSLEKRFLPVARKLKDLGVGADGEIEVLETVTVTASLPAASELAPEQPLDGDASPRRWGARERKLPT